MQIMKAFLGLKQMLSQSGGLLEFEPFGKRQKEFGRAKGRQAERVN